MPYAVIRNPAVKAEYCDSSGSRIFVVLAVALVTRLILVVAKMELVNGVIAQKMTIIADPAKNTDQ